MSDNFIVSIDIGSQNIVIFLANEENGRLEIFGYAKGSSAGVINGEIVDIKKTANAIQKVKKSATLSCNTDFNSVTANISDINLRMINRTSETHISGVVKTKDVDDVIKTAQSIKISNTHQFINSVTHHYTLDKDPLTGKGAVVDQPIGEKAENLEISMHLMSASNQCVKKIESSIAKSKLGLFCVVPNSIASSEPYLTKDEKNQGVCLMDVGAGTIDLSIFKGGNVVDNALIKFGTDKVTLDIADAFNTTFEQAEYLKIKYGKAQAKMIREDKLIQFMQQRDLNYYYLSHRSLCEVIEASYLELFSLIKKKLTEKKLNKLLKSGFVLVGGGMQINGCDRLAFKYFKNKAKIGNVNTNFIRVDTNSVSSNDDLLSPEYACALGLLLFNHEGINLKEEQSNNKTGFLSKIKLKF